MPLPTLRHEQFLSLRVVTGSSLDEWKIIKFVKLFALDTFANRSQLWLS